MSEQKISTTGLTVEANRIGHLEVHVDHQPGTSDATNGGNQAIASSMPPKQELENVLNEAIAKSLPRVDLSDKLRAPSEERQVDLRSWNMYDQTETLTRQVSAAELKQFRKSGTIIGMADLFPPGTRFVALLGGPGSGKTTFIRRYGKNVLHGEIAGMRDISIVYLIDACRLAQSERETTFWNFLFCDFTSRGISSEAKQWMMDSENQHHILILIDGLQDFQNTALDRQHQAIGYEDEALPWVILSGLLQGELLPRAKILATSRSYGIQNYHHRIRPQSTIKLAGFTDENTKYLFKELVGPEVAKRWERFSDSLKSLCSNPLYLVYVAYMQISRCNPNPDIDSVSSIMMCIIQNFCYRNDWDKDSESFKALKRFCLEKSKRGQVVYSCSEFPEAMGSEEMRRLFLAVPEGKPDILEQPKRKSFVFFSDLLILESLACLGFLDLPLAEYGNILKDDVKSYRFYTIQILACGILLRDGQQFEDLLEDISDKEEKKKLLLETLQLRDSAGLSSSDTLHHLECLHEISADCDADIFPSEIDLSMQDLTRCATHIVAPPIARCKNLVKLVLHRCVLDSNKVKILWKSLRDSSVKIQHFDIGSNPDIGPSGLKTTAKIVSHCQVFGLVLDKNRLTREHMTEFLTELRRYGTRRVKLERLSLGHNPELGVDGLEAAAGTVDVTKLRVLDVSYCDVTSNAIEKMMGYNLGSLQELRLSGNVESLAQLSVVGECVARNSVDQLHIDYCDLKPRDIEDLEKSLSGHSFPMKTINLRGNSKISSNRKCYQALCRLAKLGVRMDIGDCEFSEEEKEAINKHYVEISEMNTHRFPKRSKRD